MHMKKILLPLVLLSLLLLTACQNSGAEAVRWDSVHHKNGEAISLDMLRQEAEKQLPPVADLDPNPGSSDESYGANPAEQIRVVYYEDKVNQIILEEPAQEGTQWTLEGGIAPGASLEKVKAVFGTPTREGDLISYYYDANHTLLTEDNADQAVYMVCFTPEGDRVDQCAVLMGEPALTPAEE